MNCISKILLSKTLPLYATSVFVSVCLSTFLQVQAKPSAALIIDTIAQSALPKEGQATLALIQKGGPFPYKDKDGSVFGNREGTLPKQKRGYYTEYTVKTPYARNRGAKRIVAGKGATGEPATSGEYYYSDDHYATFKRIMLNK